MKRYQIPPGEVKVIKINDQFRTIRTTSKQTTKLEKINQRTNRQIQDKASSQIIKDKAQEKFLEFKMREKASSQQIKDQSQDEFLEFKLREKASSQQIKDQSQEKYLEFKLREKSKTYINKVHQQQQDSVLPRTSNFMLKTPRANEGSGLSPVNFSCMIRKSNMVLKTPLVIQGGCLSPVNFHWMIKPKQSKDLTVVRKSQKLFSQRYNGNRQNLSRVSNGKNDLCQNFKDSSSSQNDKNLIWDDSYFETLIESNFKFELTEQEKFILLYKFRYEQEHKSLQYIKNIIISLSRTEMEKKLEQFGFEFNKMNEEIFEQNFAFQTDFSESQNYKEFLQYIVKMKKKERFLPDIN